MAVSESAGNLLRKTAHVGAPVSDPRYRLAIVASHPIQYYAPWFRELAKHFDLEVLYAHRQDAAGQATAGFGVKFDWDVPLLEGYRHRWLRNVSRQPGLANFGGCDTPELADLIRPERFDAVLVYGWNRKSSIQAVRAGKRQRVPVFMRGDSQLLTPRTALITLIKYLPYRWYLPRLAAHLFVGQRNREYLRHYGVPERRLFFVPHCVDNGFFQSRAATLRSQGRREELRRSLELSEGTLVALFVGKLTPKKRPLDILHALARLSPFKHGIAAVFVGSGALEGELLRIAGELGVKTEMCGFKNQTELPDYYALADVLVLPSNAEETWGLVVNEAMAAGLPAVVSDAAGCSADLIEPGETGFTYPVGDSAALADRLVQVQTMLQQPRAAMAAALHRKMNTYSFNRACEGVAEAMAAIQRRHHGQPTRT